MLSAVFSPLFKLENISQPIHLSVISHVSLSHFNSLIVWSQSDGAGKRTEALVLADSSSSVQLINRWAGQTAAAESRERDEVPHLICLLLTTAGASLKISAKDWWHGRGVTHVAMNEGQLVLDKSDGDLFSPTKKGVYFQYTEIYQWGKRVRKTREAKQAETMLEHLTLGERKTRKHQMLDRNCLY